VQVCIGAFSVRSCFILIHASKNRPLPFHIKRLLPGEGVSAKVRISWSSDSYNLAGQSQLST